MSYEIPTIDLVPLLLAFAPAMVVVAILLRWAQGAGNALYALLRMGVQLLLIGYLLRWLFTSEDALLVLGVLVVMVLASSWIALGSVPALRHALFGSALLSVVVGGGLTLLWATQVVLSLEPWFSPRALIPLAGMTFSTAMNRVSLAAERYFAEQRKGVPSVEARNIALRAALIPTVNSLFAAGLVALPGMMTGQILAGVSPLVATRYQILVMCMLFGAAGISASFFLMLAARHDPAGRVGTGEAGAT